MKKLTILILLITLVNLIGFAEVPAAFNYQVVVRNTAGELLVNKNVSFRISILLNSESGTVVYSEKHIATTNSFGLVNLKIGKGTVQSGIFSPGGWGLAPHFVKVEIDTSGGNSFVLMGTSQLLTVPYAFHAQTVEVDNVDDADADPSNELQTISLSDNKITLSDGGGTITLPSTSLWTQSGSNIYYNAGKVAIGSTYATTAPLYVSATTSEIARFESTASSNWISLYSSGTRKGILWNSGDDIKLRSDAGGITFQTNGNNNRLNIETDGTISTPNTGSGIHILPLAYGYVNVSGTLLASRSTSNISSSRSGSTGTYEYKVELTGISSNFIAVVTPAGSYISFPRVTYYSSYFTVDFMSHDGSSGQANNFSFVIFGQPDNSSINNK